MLKPHRTFLGFSLKQTLKKERLASGSHTCLVLESLKASVFGPMFLLLGHAASTPLTYY